MEYGEEVTLRCDGAGGSAGVELTIRIRELPLADGVHGSTGNQLWYSGVVLARELLRRPELVKGKRVVELGAGCGLLGIAAASLASSVLLTDGDPEAAGNLAHNVELNEHVWRSKAGEPARDVQTQCLTWQDAVASPAFTADGEPADVVMGSDIIYGHWGEAVAKAMLSLVKDTGLILLAASEDSVRRSGIPAFQACLREYGFRIEETKLVVPLGMFRLYECRAPGDGEPRADPALRERVESEPSEDIIRQLGA